MNNKTKKLFIVISEDWSFWSHRRSLAISAIENNYDVTLITKVNDLENKIKSLGISVVDIDFVRSSQSPFKDLSNIIKLIRLFRREKPDLIHCVALKTILICSIATIFRNNTVLINAFTGLGYVFSSDQLKAKVIRFFIKPIFRILLRRKNCWTIFQNPDDRNLFEKLSLVNAQQTILIRGSGVDISEFVKTEDKNTKPVVMLASRMLWDKGIGEFVDAAKCAKKENIAANFCLVGDVDPENPMSIPISVLKQWRDEGYILWQGHSNDMPKTLSTASIVCLPSYREGLPKVLLEAAAVGRPLIATDVPGCREIVRHGKNGLLVGLKDVDSLYQAIKELISNREKRIKMGDRSREIVESELSSKIINEKTLDLYKAALA